MRQDILEFLSPWLTATIAFKFLVTMAEGDKRFWISCRHDSWRQEMSSASQYRSEEMLFVAVTHGDKEHLLRTIPRKGLFFSSLKKKSNKTIFPGFDLYFATRYFGILVAMAHGNNRF